LRGEVVIWALAVLIAVALGMLVGFGVIDAGLAVLTVLMILVVGIIASRLGSPLDKAWLPQWVLIAFTAKLIAAGARYAFLVHSYEGVGDATGYHGRGLALAEVWRTFTVPTSGLFGSEGTRFVSQVTGLLYTPYRPSMLGGFFLFSTLAFLGQLAFYAAFRRAESNGRLKGYAFALFFLPSIVFWPSSIGKESLMLFALGIAAYSVARLFDGYRLGWVIPLTAALLFMAEIRVHITALVVTALAGAMLLSRGPEQGGAQLRRIALITVSVVAFTLVVTMTSEAFGIDASGSDLDPFLDDLQRRTQQGGSAVEGDPVRSPADIPEATLRVLFRPFLTEAHNFQALLSSLEGVVLMALLVWRLPSMVRRFSALRRRPYLMFSLFFSIGFIVAFSSIFNLGIIARQRSQVLPFVVALLVGLGWPSQAPTEPTTELPGRHLAETTA